MHFADVGGVACNDLFGHDHSVLFKDGSVHFA